MKQTPNPSQKITVDGRKLPQSATQEHRMEMEARLRMAEADARWRRGKEMILVGSTASVVLSVCVMSAIVFCSSSYSLTDRQLMAALLGHVLALLIGVLVGKNLKF